MTDRSECFLRIRAVLARTGLSRSTLYRKMDSGNFPRQIKIAERCCAWRSSAVDAWLRNRCFITSPMMRHEVTPARML